MANGRNQDFDFEGARDFERRRVRSEAEAAFREEGAPVYRREEVHPEAEEVSLRELMAEAMAQGRRLLRAEWRLARSELRREAKKAQKGTGMVAAGAVAGLLAAMALVGFLIAALSGAMPVWASCLVVGLALLAATAVLVRTGLNSIKNVKPDETIHSLKEDTAWASETLRAARQQTHGHA